MNNDANLWSIQSQDELKTLVANEIEKKKFKSSLRATFASKLMKSPIYNTSQSLDLKNQSSMDDLDVKPEKKIQEILAL